MQVIYLDSIRLAGYPRKSVAEAKPNGDESNLSNLRKSAGALKNIFR
jgi:hypothetical protein